MGIVNMRVLAIDTSASTGSAALLQGHEPVAEREWPNTRANNQRLFTELVELLKHKHITAAEIDIFAAGLGPGSFSGVRTCIAAARAMALPGDKPVIGISGAEALAWDVSIDDGGTRVSVVGDARRGRLWLAGFAMKADGPEQTTDFELLAPGELGERLKDYDTVVTPEWERLEPVLAKSAPEHARVIGNSLSPRARTIGALAAGKYSPGPARMPLSPIYLHPPVAESH